jgi:hypothetical protein
MEEKPPHRKKSAKETDLPALHLPPADQPENRAEKEELIR